MALPLRPESLILGGIGNALDFQRQRRGCGGSAYLVDPRHCGLHGRPGHSQAQPGQHLAYALGRLREQPDVVVPHQRLLGCRRPPHPEVRRELRDAGQGLPLGGSALPGGRRDHRQQGEAPPHARGGRSAGSALVVEGT